MKQALVFIMAMMMFIPSWAEDGSRHAYAKELNAKVTALLDGLESITDTAVYYTRIHEVLRQALLCDQNDGEPEANGRIRYAFRKSNRKRLENYRQQLVDGGNYFYDHHDNQRALACYAAYLTCTNSPLFQGKASRVDSRVAYFAALLALGSGDYPTAVGYANIARSNPDLELDAIEIKNECLRSTMVTHADSTNYLMALIRLHLQVPDNQTYFRQIMDYYEWPGRTAAAIDFAHEETRQDSTNVLAWVMLGDNRQRLGDEQGAVEAYRRAIDLSPSCTEARRKLEQLTTTK